MEKRFNKMNELCDYIEELEKDLKDPLKRELLYKNFLPEKIFVKSDNHRLIGAILRKQGVKSVSDTTIYRLLFVKKNSKSLYKQIRDEDITVKEAYEKLRPAKKQDTKADSFGLNSSKEIAEAMAVIVKYLKESNLTDDDEKNVVKIDSLAWDIRKLTKKYFERPRKIDPEEY